MFSPALQAAGHDGAMVSDNGAVFVKPSTPNELEFYRNLQADEHADMAEHTCAFMGTLSVDNKVEVSEFDYSIENQLTMQESLQKSNSNSAASTQSQSNPIIVLENLLHGYKQPNVIDIKLGTILYDGDASEEKKKRLAKVAESTTSGSMGIRIAGMNVYDPISQQRKVYNKFFGRKLTEDTIVDGLAEYFPGIRRQADKDKRTDMCEAIVSTIQSIYEVMQTKEISIISSSILVIYEGDPEEFERKLSRNMIDSSSDQAGDAEDADSDRDLDSNGSDESGLDDGPLLTVKLIDFGHAEFRKDQGPDLNLLRGLESLISIFQRLSERRG